VTSYLETVTSGGDFLGMGLLPVPGWLDFVVDECRSGSHKSTLDPALPAIVTLCEAFAADLGDFVLAHDESSECSFHRRRAGTVSTAHAERLAWLSRCFRRATRRTAGPTPSGSGRHGPPGPRRGRNNVPNAPGPR